MQATDARTETQRPAEATRSPTEWPAYGYADANAFFLAVEGLARHDGLDLLRDPRAIVVGHDPRHPDHRRSIVTTANQAARDLGIHSGLSSAIALRIATERGREILFLPPRHDLYVSVSRLVMAVLREYVPVLSPRSIDEAAFAWEHGYDRAPAARLRELLRARTGITVSIGIASNSLLAKVGSEQAKRAADGVYIVGPGTEQAFLAPLPVRAMPGIGPKAEARLHGLGITTLGDLQQQPLESLVDGFGQAYGRFLYEASRGCHQTPLLEEVESRSQSAEHTFPRDTSDRGVLWHTLRRQAEEVAQRLREEGLVATEVGVKLRSGDWRTTTRQQRLRVSTDDARVLAVVAAGLVRRHWDQRPLRLIGLRAGRLAPRNGVVQLPLPDP